MREEKDDRALYETLEKVTVTYDGKEVLTYGHIFDAITQHLQGALPDESLYTFDWGTLGEPAVRRLWQEHAGEVADWWRYRETLGFDDGVPEPADSEGV